MVVISLFHKLSATKQTRECVDDQTWSDLGLDDLYVKLDRAIGIPGQQVLYSRLRTYVSDDKILAERSRQTAIFRSDAIFRAKVNSSFRKLSRPGAAYLAPLLLSPLPEPPRFAWRFHLLGALCPLCLVTAVFYHPLFLVALALSLINAAISLLYGQKIIPHFHGFGQISTLLRTAADLAKIDDPHGLPQLASIRGNSVRLDRLSKRLRWFLFDRSSLDDISRAVVEYLNMLFLFDIVVYLRSLGSIRGNQVILAGTLEEIGSIDAAQSIASYVEGLAHHVVPTMVDARRLEVEGLYHPLIATPVGNSLSLEGRSALISGPNMAGKTAFIRTVGINLILAQTFSFCLADRALLPRAIVRSAIRREDQLSAGVSYFFAEIKQLREFIDLSEGASLKIYLIDEIFRGTNTVERIAAATAVLRSLSRNQIVLATTHDIELSGLLADDFDMHHFGDQIVNGVYGFDYRLHAGPVQSRYAIKLLELSGYPMSITREAESIAGRLAGRLASPQPR